MIQIFAGIIDGFLLSQLLYRFTHGENKVVPEVLGMMAGGLLVILVYKMLGATDKDIQQIFAAFSSVGIGVGISRVIMQ